MASQTSGGLVKFSVALSPSLIEQLDRVAAERRVSRNNVLNYVAELGIAQYDQDEAARRRGHGELFDRAAHLCRSVSDADLEGELERRRRMHAGETETAA